MGIRGEVGRKQKGKRRADDKSPPPERNREEGLELIFDELEKFDANLTLRGPKSLADRIAKIGEHEKGTLNRLKVNLLETGVAVYEWSSRNIQDLKSFRQAVAPSEKFPLAVVRLLDLGLEAWKRSRK